MFRLPSNNITSFANQTLVRANETDSLLHVLRVMAASRISVLPIERKIEDLQHQKSTYTVGLLFVNDFMYMLTMPNFWDILNEPVVEFFKELYGPLECDPASDFRSETSGGNPKFPTDMARTEKEDYEESKSMAFSRNSD